MTGAIVAYGGCGIHDELDAHDLLGDHMTFEEFEAVAERHPETGFYIVEGDIAIPSREELYRNYQGSVRGGVSQSPLTLHTHLSGIPSGAMTCAGA